ncbi:MAG: hypothetical protein V3V61_01125 [Gammaproteobacteria bacterium]
MALTAGGLRSIALDILEISIALKKFQQDNPNISWYNKESLRAIKRLGKELVYEVERFEIKGDL